MPLMMERSRKRLPNDKEDGLPAIQIDPCEGQLLKLLLTMIHATHVVEVGTLAGYSTIAIAMALPPQGQLFSIEADPHHQTKHPCCRSRL